MPISLKPFLLALPVILGACSVLPDWLGESEGEKLKGERIAVLASEEAITADPGTEEITVSLPEAAKMEEWTGLSRPMGNLAFGGSFKTMKKYKAGDGNESFANLAAHPLVAGGMIFSLDGEGVIAAHDLKDPGNAKWKKKLVDKTDARAAFGGGMVYSEGKVYVTTGSGIVSALDAVSGGEVWSKQLKVPARAAPLLAGGKLFVATIDNQLFAINISDGRIMWNHSGLGESAGILGAATPAYAPGIVIIAYSSGELYALGENDGREVWSESFASVGRTKRVAGLSDIDADPVVDGSRVIIAAHGGRFTGLDITSGRPAWEKPFGAINTPWIAGDYIFAIVSDNRLVCMMKEDGRVKWVVPLPNFKHEKKQKDIIRWSGPVVIDGDIILTGSQGEMLAINAENGAVKRDYDIPGGVMTAPVVAAGKSLLVTKGGDLVVFE